MTTVDDAVAVLRREAESHEAKGNGEFCSDNRCALVVFVMCHLGLGLVDLGLIADGLAAELFDDDDDEPPADEWPATVVDTEH